MSTSTVQIPAETYKDIKLIKAQWFLLKTATRASTLHHVTPDEVRFPTLLCRYCIDIIKPTSVALQAQLATQ